MIFRDQIKIRVAAATVWQFVSNPENQPRWNPKVKDVLPLSHGSPGIGYRYRLCYVMSGKATECDAEIVEFDAPRRLATRMRELTQSDSKAGDRTFVEEFTIIDHADYVLLQQKVTVSGFRIPVVFRFLFWLLMRFGKPVGPRYLESLRGLIEGGTSP